MDGASAPKGLSQRGRRNGGIFGDHLVATPERFELPTVSFEGCCSIQLSYGAPMGWPMEVLVRHHRGQRVVLRGPQSSATSREPHDDICGSMRGGQYRGRPGLDWD